MIMLRRLGGARVGAWPLGLTTTLSLVALLCSGFAGFTVGASPAEAKTPGSTYCYYGTCHRVKTIAETEQLVGTNELVQASFYDSCLRDSYNPCGLTSSGEAFSPNQANNAASPIYPDGTTLLVWSPETKQAAVLRVNNAGPYWGNRRLDVSRAAADALGFRPRGIGQLHVRVLNAPSEAEATYVHNRKYKPVLGPVGQYASIADAQAGLAVMHALDSMPTTTLLAPLSTASLEQSIDAGALRIDVPPQVKVAALAKTKSVARVSVVAKRQAAKAQRVAAKRKSAHARRSGARRTTVASRRGNLVAARRANVRYARAQTARKASVRRGIADASVRSRRLHKRPVVSRSLRGRRVAELPFGSGLGISPGLTHGLRGIPTGIVRDTETPRLRAPSYGPVQVV